MGDRIVTSSECPSIRAAAAALKMHHSTMQARHDWFTGELGYDPRSPRGRARYEPALRPERPCSLAIAASPASSGRS